MAQVRLRELVKRYGPATAVDHVSLTVEDGEFVALVGPSGCGKTTTLNLVAGLIEASGGDIFIGERRVTELDPKDRDIAMVFQNYALYPNKTVFQNLAFPLKMRRLGRTQIEEKVRGAARALDIEPLLGAAPPGIVRGPAAAGGAWPGVGPQPRAFLMDEPLSNLDAQLRVQMRAELKRFHRDLGATVIYVTHDQLEAVTMADKMAVMNGGVLQQYDAPERVFAQPVNTFVAGFVGSPAMNLLRARVVGNRVEGDGWGFGVTGENARKLARATSGEVVVGARHGAIAVHAAAVAGAVPGRVYTVEPTGDLTFLHVSVGGAIVVVSVAPGVRVAPDEPVWLEFDPARLHLFEGKSLVALTAD